jgi:hypothetical protein
MTANRQNLMAIDIDPRPPTPSAGCGARMDRGSCVGRASTRGFLLIGSGARGGLLGRFSLSRRLPGLTGRTALGVGFDRLPGGALYGNALTTPRRRLGQPQPQDTVLELGGAAFAVDLPGAASLGSNGSDPIACCDAARPRPAPCCRTRRRFAAHGPVGRHRHRRGAPRAGLPQRCTRRRSRARSPEGTRSAR